MQRNQVNEMSLSLRIDLSPKPIFKPQIPTTLVGSRAKDRIRCSSESRAGDSMALKLSREVAKRRAVLAQSREAVEKSRDILFRELCLYLSMETNEVITKWKVMEEEEKWVLLRKFVSDWALNFHPLSVKSVKDLLDEKLLGHQK